MTTQEYIARCLEEDFTAAEVKNYFDKRLEELLKDDGEPLPDEDAVKFQKHLNNKEYPYLACFRALRDAGYTESDALEYVERIIKR